MSEITFLRQVPSGHDSLICVEAWNERFLMSRGFASIKRFPSDAEALKAAQEEALNASLMPGRPVVILEKGA